MILPHSHHKTLAKGRAASLMHQASDHALRLFKPRPIALTGTHSDFMAKCERQADYSTWTNEFRCTSPSLPDAGTRPIDCLQRVPSGGGDSTLFGLAMRLIGETLHHPPVCRVSAGALSHHPFSSPGSNFRMAMRSSTYSRW